MKISELYTYPIKSLRGTRIDFTKATKHGFPYDRRFMLRKVLDPEASTPEAKYKNMHLVYFPEMMLFSTYLTFPVDDGSVQGHITVTYQPPDGECRILEIPLTPDEDNLEHAADVVMHKSSTKAYNMDSKFNEWFSSCFGYNVELIYLGKNLRDVLMTTSANARSGGSWLSAITNNIPFLGRTEEEKITFADCASYLVVSKTSLDDLSSRLEGDETVDMTKFRPNIVVEGAKSAWEEDMWAELRLGDVKIRLDQNCPRCASINIDYSTGKPANGESGVVLKRMQKDRRIDAGSKWSPVFGRYGFILQPDDGKVLSVGDEVTVTKRNTEYTKFDWPGLGGN
ncbi:MOSC domain-containing protein [Patellaria atrata CBS 101060]|uniref:MOSC domain-containing protein n=1 Tax=Patellaria atrata CBS 101060 TaxID=1346257 RepID=A0A9P4VJ64_9PEZI|nr:MOSC domain-containing protein [Patellaria atrata CBS 101060]